MKVAGGRYTLGIALPFLAWMGPVILKWGNVQDQEVTLHPNAENVLNVCYIRHSDYQVVPYVDADLTWQKIYNTFKRQPGGVEAYQFDACITYSHRVNGPAYLHLIKPISVEQWLRSLEGLRDGSKAKIRNIMSAVFSHAIWFEIADKNPITPVRQSAKRTTVR
jgi:hypothetical protein